MMDPNRIPSRFLTVGLALAALTLGTGAVAGAADAMAPEAAAPETGTATIVMAEPAAQPAPQATPPVSSEPAEAAPVLGPAVAEGVKRLNAGDAAGAVERLRAAAAADPGNAAARYYLGYAFYRMGDFAQARAAFTAAYRADPGFSPVPPAH
jgi:Flp pilus assembly protein TadD